MAAVLQLTAGDSYRYRECGVVNGRNNYNVSSRAFTGQTLFLTEFHPQSAECLPLLQVPPS